MKKHNYTAPILICLLTAGMLFTLAACGRTDTAQVTQPEEGQESSRLSTEAADSGTGNETADTVSDDSGAVQGGSRILIAYFTAAENSGVDAVSSASYTTINGTASCCGGYDSGKYRRRFVFYSNFRCVSGRWRRTD